MDDSSSRSDPAPLDRVLTNCRVIDPANGIDGRLAVGIRGGRIAAVAPGLAARTPRVALDLDGAIVTPGFIDVHVHAYEWVTNFGVAPDAAGVHSGATTIVDQGSTGVWTFGGFKTFIVEPALTDVRAFVSINVAGALKGGMEGEALHSPGIVGTHNTVPELVREAKRAGVLFDLGHGVNLSFRIARMMMEGGIYPDTIGSDVHGDFNSYHDLSILDYSLMGAVNKLIALGMK